MSLSRRKNLIRSNMVLIGMLGIFASVVFFRDPIRVAIGGVGTALSRPFWVMSDTVSHWRDTWYAYVSDRRALLAELSHLREERATLMIENESKQAVALRYEALLNEWGQTAKKKVILAAVLGRGEESPYDTLRIDIGSAHGLRDENLVWVGDIPIGSIKNVTGRSALVELFSTPGRVTRAQVGREHIPVTLSGRGNGDFVFTVPAEILIIPGMMITLPGFPTALVGQVFAVEKTEHDAFQTVRARIPINLQTLLFVGVEQSS